jgi:hypothetical protein
MHERGCLYVPLFTNCREGSFSETQGIESRKEGRGSLSVYTSVGIKEGFEANGTKQHPLVAGPM